MSRTISLSVMVVAVLCSAAWAAEGQQDSPRVPEELCVLVELQDVAGLSERLAGFIAATGLPPTLPPMQGPLTMLLKSTDPTVVDWDKPVRLAVLQPPQPTEPVFIFSVLDAERYIASLGPDVKESAQDGDVRIYVQRLFGGPGVEGETFAVGLVGKQVVLSPDVAVAKAAVAIVKAGQLPPEPILPGKGVSASVTVARLLDGITRTSGDPFDKLRSLIPPPGAHGSMGPSAPGSEAMFRAILDAELDAVESLARQIESVVASVEVDAERIRIKWQLLATEEGGLSRYIASVPAGKPRTLKYLPADAWLVSAAKFGDLGPLVDWSCGLMERIAASGPEGAKPIEAMAEIIRNMVPLYGNEFSFAMTSGPGEPLALAKVIEVKDAKAVSEAMLEMEALTEAMGSSFFSTTGFTMQTTLSPSVETYKGRDIAAWECSFDFKVPKGIEGAGAEHLKRAPAMQQKMFERIYGPKMVMHYAFIDQDMLLCMGPDSLSELKKLIDGQSEPVTESAAFKTALAGMPEEYTRVFYLSLGDYANWYLGILQVVFEGMPGRPMVAMMGQMMAEIEFGRGPGLVGASRWTGRTVEYELVIPAAEVAVLVEGFERAMMHRMNAVSEALP